MGGFHYDEKGYPRWNNTNGLVHRDVARPGRGEVVHHRDGDKGNFRRSNLQVMSRSEHSSLHARRKRY
jgi:hypothetical protein